MRGLLCSGYTERWDDIVELMLAQGQDRVRLFLIRYTFQAAAHSIWRERNNMRHGDAPQSAIHIVKYIDKLVRNRADSLRGVGNGRYSKAMGVWFATR